MQNNQLKVAIIGGGIGGLSLALSISKLVPDYDSKMEIDIYESTSSLKAQVGAGIGLWPNSWAIFEALGVDGKLAKCVTGNITNEPVPDMLLIRKADQPEGRDLFTISTTCGANVFFHRADFQLVLLDSLPPTIRVHTRKRLRFYRQNTAGVELEFEDGTMAHADIVVGADGLQSRVRKAMIEKLSQNDPASNPVHLADPSWTGYIIYRSLIPRQRLINLGWENHRSLSGWTVHSGLNAAIMSYPIRKGADVTFIGIKSWVEHEGATFSQELLEDLLKKEGFNRPIKSPAEKSAPEDTAMSNERDPWADNGGGGQLSAGRGRWVARVGVDEVRHTYKGFEPEVQALVECIDTALAWAVHRVGPLTTLVDGNVCLLGDAAHAMHPQQGAGAGQAVLDGYVLAHLLAAAFSAGQSNIKPRISAVLETYDAVRRPASEHVAEASRANGFHFLQHIQDDDMSWRPFNMNNEEEVKLIRDRMTRQWEYAWDKKAAKLHAEKAVRIFQEHV